MPSPDWLAVRRLLAVRMDNIGDMVMLSPALRTLSESLPGVEITLLASPAGSQVAPLLPWVKDVIPWRAVWQDVSGALPFDPQREMALIDDLRSRRFDAAVIFTSFTQSPHPPAYACYLAGIPLRLGHSREFGGQVISPGGNPPAVDGHQVDRSLALLELAGFEVRDRSIELHIPADARRSAGQLLEKEGIDPAAPFIALVPGASCEARRYPPQRFAEVARRLAAASGLSIVILGSQREAGLLAPVIETAGRPGIYSLIGRTSLPELASVIQNAAVVIANNSAALHLADAFAVPQVILYSGTEYLTQWQPRTSPARLLRRETHCSPCFRFTCPYALECLDVPPQEVVDAVLKLLAETRPVAAGTLEIGNR